MDGGKRDPAHLDTDDHERHRRRHAAHILHRCHRKVRDGDIRKEQDDARCESHERRSAELQEHLLQRETVFPAGIPYDEVRPQRPEHRRIRQIVKHTRRHARLTEERHIHRHADEDGIRDAAGTDKNAAASLGDVKQRGEHMPREVGGEDRDKGQHQIRRRSQQCIMREIGIQRMDHERRQRDSHRELRQILRRILPKPSLLRQKKAQPRYEDHFKNAGKALPYRIHECISFDNVSSHYTTREKPIMHVMCKRSDARDNGKLPLMHATAAQPTKVPYPVTAELLKKAIADVEALNQ